MSSQSESGTCHHIQSFARGEKSINIQILWHNADIGARLPRIGINISSPYRNAAASLHRCSSHDIDKSRFASTIRPQKPKNTANRHFDIN